MQTAKRILLVDDDSDDQIIFVEVIARINPSIKCDIANNGAQALTILSELPPYDIIFMDLNMPVMDGLTCLSKVKNSEHNKIPVVMLSTSGNPIDIERSKALGAAMYCIKPTSYEELYEKLRTIVTKDLTFHAI